MKSIFIRSLKLVSFKHTVFAVILLLHLTASAQRRGLFVNQYELDTWRLRAAGLTGANYKDTGDVQLHSPADWKRICAYAKSFLNRNDTALFRWNGPMDTDTVDVAGIRYYNAVTKSRTNEPSVHNQLGYHIKDAAFVYLVDKNNSQRQQYKQRVKEDLLYHARLDRLNFSLNGLHGDPVTYPPHLYRDSHPFQILNWMTSFLLAMDFIDAAYAEEGSTNDWLAPEEREQIKTFFKRAANFWVKEQDWYFDSLSFKDRHIKPDHELYTARGGYNFTTGITRVPGKKDGLDHCLYYSKKDTTLTRGPLFFGAMGSFNNRNAVSYRFGVLYGLKFNEPDFIARGKRFFKDWIKYSVYPNGAVGELERWGADYPEGGWSYATDVIATCGTMAEALSRNGDNSLYDFTTRLGWESGNPNYSSDHGTVCQPGDPDKSLLLTLKAMKKIINREVEWYGTNNINHVPVNTWTKTENNTTTIMHYNTLMDGKIPEAKFYALHDAGWFMIFGNHFATDSDVQQMIYRTGPYMDKYWKEGHPVNPLANQGGHLVWRGDWGIFPGVGFMFGKMINTPPTVSITAPATNAVFQAPASVILTASASDANGIISKVEFYRGSLKLGEDSTAPYTCALNDVAAGTYSLTARAIDNTNLSATSTAVTITVTPTFYRAINLNGNALVIDGQPWEASASAANFAYTGRTFANQSIALNPPTDSSRAAMIRSSLWRTSGTDSVTVTLSAVPDGTYQVFLYSWEDNTSTTFTIFLEGVVTVSGFPSGTAGKWKNHDLGTVIITDGNIKIKAKGGDACISGLIVWKTGSDSLSAPVHPVTFVNPQSEENEVINVHPVPFKNGLTIKLSAQEKKTGIVQSALIDVSGNVLKRTDHIISAGQSVVYLNHLDDLKPGLYILKISTTNSVRTSKVIRE